MTEPSCDSQSIGNLKTIASPTLSICIPTYNRRDKIVELVRAILSVEGLLEVCVHVDGSVDGTRTALEAIGDPRLRVSEAENRGRAAALRAAIMMCRGRYAMPYDDDDEIDPEALVRVLRLCREQSETGAAAFVFHLRSSDGAIVGTSFPRERSNFVKLRADEGVTGDKKEIVRADLLKSVTFDPEGAYRRVPTSLGWALIALDHDALCFNESIGVKHYLAGGMTTKARKAKLANAYPMHLLYRVHCAAFLRGRYRSVRHFARSLIAMVGYGLLAIFEIGRR